MNQFSRTQLLLGKEAIQTLRQAKVAVFGIGGVGGYVCEALVRSGAWDTVGRPKTEVMAERMKSINPDVKAEVRNCFYLPENADSFDFSSYSYVVDAVDTVAAKIEIILRAQKAGVPVISSMGAGNHLDPEAFHVADLYQTRMCPLAKVMRRELKKRGVEKLKVVYSEESPLTPCMDALEGDGREELPPGKRSLPGSISYAPSIAGLLIGAQVIRDLTGR